MLRYGLILAIVCIIASGLLAGMNLLTSPRIVSQVQGEEKASLKEVMPQGERFEAVQSKDEILYYKAYDKEGRFIAVVFKATGKGYSSTVETIAGMTVDGVITAIKILSQNETPGLGAKVIEPAFTARFNNRKLEELNNVQAITGATISSTAVINSIKEKAWEIKGLIEDEK